MRKLNLIVAVIFAGMQACNSPKKAETSETPIISNELPNVTLIRADGTQFSARDLPGKTVLIFFGATCDHCQREAKDISDHLASFGDYTLYFIAMDQFPVINKFADDYGISNKPNITLLRADGASVNNALGSLDTPTIFIYSKDKKLNRRFNGETPAVDLIRSL